VATPVDVYGTAWGQVLEGIDPEALTVSGDATILFPDGIRRSSERSGSAGSRFRARIWWRWRSFVAVAAHRGMAERRPHDGCGHGELEWLRDGDNAFCAGVRRRA
jgi:hypothetical protein